jgi:hypothetical protein
VGARRWLRTFGRLKGRGTPIATTGGALKLSTRLTNLGIQISVGTAERPKPLLPDKDADQENPRRVYVYAHADASGNIFYVGKGEGRRAWSTDRHPLWCRYVDKHLGGKYKVRILRDNLSEQKAEEVEAEWIAQCSDNLVNWQNMGRTSDFEALDRFHKLRDANRSLIQQAKARERADLAEAAQMYLQAIEAVAQYASISYEKGLVGKLLEEEAEELGRCGEIEALDRLTLCLVKLERPDEADGHADRYFARYRRDLQLGTAERIRKRIEKALARAAKGAIAAQAAEQCPPDRPKAAGR